MKHPIFVIHLRQVFYSKEDAIAERSRCVEQYSKDYHISNLYDRGGWTFEMTEKHEFERRRRERRRQRRRRMKHAVYQR